MPWGENPHAVSVLIGEDDPAAAQKLEEIVQNHGHIVVDIAYCDADLIGAAFRYRPDLVLTSTKLNGQPTGVTAVRTLHEFYNRAALFSSNKSGGLLIGVRPPYNLVVSQPYSEPEVSLALRAAIANLARRPDLPILRLDALSHDVTAIDGQSAPPKSTVKSPNAAGILSRLSNDFGIAHACRGLAAIKRFALARVDGVGTSFSKKLDKEIGEGLASGIAMLLLAASTPILAWMPHLPSEFAWIGPALAFARLLRSR